MDCLYIIIPAYNEEANIETVIDEWYPVVEKHNGSGKSRLVVIDDGSRDATYEKICACAEGRALLCPLTKKNGGHGATVRKGYEYALKQGADYIFQTDSDGQTLPAEFEPFWEQREQYEMVIGRRKGRQDGASRVMVTKVLKFVVRCTFGESIPDANTPYRLMNAKSLETVLPLVPHDYNLTNVLVSVLYKKQGFRMKFVPITFRPRQGGVNSINLKRIFGIGKKALRDFLVLNRRINRKLKENKREK